MMAATRSQNRQMFWRIVRHLLTANRGRLFVILLALGAGAAVTSALLNLQVDAKRRLTTEFRAFGANVVITPRESNRTPGPDRFLEEVKVKQALATQDRANLSSVEFIYGMAVVGALV